MTSPPTTTTIIPVLTDPTTETFFRRPLPPPGIELSSPQGVTLFTEALASGHARCFFKLTEQLTTQEEPTFCGLATLVTILNAAEIDPGRKWKGVWRFYSQELLDCCIDLSEIKRRGVSFEEVACLARCNGLNVQAIHANHSNEAMFRKVVERITKADMTFLAVSYDRQLLGQTGTGHFSPIGAYHPGKDLVLILDVARFKYRPHWVPLATMFQAMDTIDDTVNLKRGWIEMQARSGLGVLPPARLFSFSLTTSFEHAFEVLSQGLADVARQNGGVKDMLHRVANLLDSVIAVRFCALCDYKPNALCMPGLGGGGGSSSCGTGHFLDGIGRDLPTDVKRDIRENKLARAYEPDPTSGKDIAKIMYLLSLDREFWEFARRDRVSDLFVPLEDFTSEVARIEVQCARYQMKELRAFHDKANVA